MLLKGNEALEYAGNMKTECKQTALECLQSLDEMVLALSDSRSGHKYYPEKAHSQRTRTDASRGADKRTGLRSG
ncbi:unnamed protein product, partial [Iphiclides podalirius]